MIVQLFFKKGTYPSFRINWFFSRNHNKYNGKSNADDVQNEIDYAEDFCSF